MSFIGGKIVSSKCVLGWGSGNFSPLENISAPLSIHIYLSAFTSREELPFCHSFILQFGNSDREAFPLPPPHPPPLSRMNSSCIEIFTVPFPGEGLGATQLLTGRWTLYTLCEQEPCTSQQPPCTSWLATLVRNTSDTNIARQAFSM